MARGAHVTVTALALLMAAAPAHADRPKQHDSRESNRPEETVAAAADEEEPALAIGGIERPARESDDSARAVGNVLLFVPRNTIDLLFRGTNVAAGLIADEQLVPRYRDLFGTKSVAIYLFPTLFAETDKALNVGARMIADSRYVQTAFRAGYGGPDDVVFESRLRLRGGRRVPFVVALEGFYSRDSELEYYGLGITPKQDPRNRFTPSAPADKIGLYRQKRVRGIASIGLRLSNEFEFLLSGSLGRRQVEDSSDGGAAALSKVFVPGTVPGAAIATPWIGYAEVAARFDSREYRGRPTPGLLVEGYFGGANEFDAGQVSFMRTGFRGAASLPVYRRSNILSGRIVLDRLVPLGGVAVPFTELPRQPDYRGFDTRRDFISMVGSIDYTWQLVPFMGMRLFLDGATVAPSLYEFDFDQLKEMRFAAGLGVDFFTDTSELASFAVSTGPDSVKALLSIGVPTKYGDRQHRK